MDLNRLSSLSKKNFIAESLFAVNCFSNGLTLSGNYFYESEEVVCSGPDRYEEGDPEVKHADIVHIGEQVWVV